MKKIFLIFGFLLFSQNTFAAVHSVENISEKVKGDRLSLSDVNSILGTIRGFFFDDSTGFVGIGTDEPSAKLEVAGDIKLSDRGKNIISYRMALGEGEKHASTILGNNVAPVDGGNTENIEVIQSDSIDSHWFMVDYARGFTFHSNPPADVGAEYSERGGELMRITTEGKVGIGTQSPESELHIGKYATVDSQITSVDSIFNNASYDIVTIGNDAGQADGSTITAAGLRFQSVGGDQTTYGTRLIQNGKQFDIWAGSGAQNHVATFDSNGNVGIGTSSPGAKLEINAQDSSEQVILRRTKVNTQDEGHYSFGADGGGLKFWSGGYANSGGSAEVLFDPNGNITANSVFYESDSRYKKEIQTLPSALEKVSALRGVSYQWKDRNDDSTKIGVVAQEIEKVYPELVHTDEDGYKSVAYSNLVAPMIEAIKELNQTVIELQSQVQHLQNAQN